MKHLASAFLRKGVLPIAILACVSYANAQMNAAHPGPVRLPGLITDPGFAGILAGSIQGTYPSAMGRSRFGALGGALFPLLTAPYPYAPPSPPVNVFNISNEPPAPVPMVDLPPPAPLPAPAPEPEPQSVTVYIATPEPANTPPPAVSPELARRNSQNLKGLAAALHVSEEGNEPSTGVAPALPPSRETEPLLLIALKDRNIVTAIAYWTDHGDLHYVTPAREQKQVPLSDVDMEKSRELNNERGVPFRVML